MNYNQNEHTKEFLESVVNSGYENLEIFIIDNASSSPIEKSLENKFRSLQIIHSTVNLGFAGGNNLGISQSSGKYLFFLNNDTIVKRGFFENIVTFLEQNPDIGIVSPKIVYQNQHIQYAGSIKINTLTGRGKKIGNQAIDDGAYDLVYETAYAHGAAMAISREVLEKVGPMDEEYFLYYEELDWTNRIVKAGYKAFYYGKTSIIHKESMSIGKESPLKTYYMNRNRILFLRKNVSRIECYFAILFFVLFSLPKSSFRFLLQKKDTHLKNLWRGVLWHINKKYVFKNY